MNRTYHYWLVANTGATHAIAVEGRSESIANTEAKIEVERWLRRNRMHATDLIRFDLTHVTP